MSSSLLTLFGGLTFRDRLAIIEQPIVEDGVLVVDEGVLDPLRVVDMHRRHAYCPSEGFMVGEITTTLRKLGFAMTCLGEEGDFCRKDYQKITTRVAVVLSDLAGRAQLVGATQILLPLSDKSPMAGYMQEVITLYNIAFPFRFRDKPYDLDLSYYGKIDVQLTESPLYKNAGGCSASMVELWDIDQDRKNQWRQEISQASGKTGRVSRPAL